MREKGMSLKSACETLGISRSGQYRKESQIGMMFWWRSSRSFGYCIPFGDIGG